MPQTNLLLQYGLARNPFTDRTAEKTELDETSLYIHSDLQHFKPSDETYLFFGKRGSGKTTIRLAMQRAYEQANEELAATGQGEHFMVDLCRPGHMTSCLKDFQEITGCTNDNWDATLVENWTSADLVDCIYSYAITRIVELLAAEDDERRKFAAQLIQRLKTDGKLVRRFLILAHLYARTDDATLAFLRKTLQPWNLAAFIPAQLTAPKALLTVGALATAACGLLSLTSTAPADRGALGRSASGALAGGSGSRLSVARDSMTAWLPSRVADPPWLAESLGLVATTGVLWTVGKYRRANSMRRAAALQANIRVVKRRPVADLAYVLDSLVSSSDSVDTIRQIHIGVSAHQKLERLLEIVKLLGFQSLAVFGDCFDEVTLLDPVCFPGAIKQFAKEVCRNDLLNFGRMHFFFPDSRINLDLTTDKTLKDARFDRHFVRDMVWSRHQLEELAERRFQAAQEKYGLPPGNGRTRGGSGDGVKPKAGTSFSDLFKEVNGEDFAGYVGQLETPRELLIMMTEMFSRIEQNPGGKLKAQDMEFAVKQAKQQSV